MIVKELKALTPLADIAEIDLNKQYLVRIREKLCSEELEVFSAVLKKSGIKGICVEGDIDFFHLSGGNTIAAKADSIVEKLHYASLERNAEPFANAIEELAALVKELAE